VKVVSILLACVLGVFTFVMASAASQWTHPVHGHKANPIFDSLYGPGHGYPADYSMGDITFDGPGNHPPASSLTNEEKYIIAGSVTSDYASDGGLSAWTSTIFAIVDAYYSQFGTIPDVLTDVEIRKIDGMQSIGDSNLREFLNPLTDQWPRLKATTASPGDVYIRPLTIDEMHHYAELSPNLKDDWFNGQSVNSETGEPAPAELTSHVYYMRIYGWNGVIFNNFQYRLAVQQ